MLIILFVLIITTSLVLSFFNIKSRIAQYFFPFYCIFVGGLSDKLGDYDAYQDVFYYILAGNDLSDIPNFEIGFKVLLKIFSFFTSDFQIVNFLIIAISIALISRVVNKYCCDARLVYAFYCIYPFLYSVAQLRNLIGVALLFTAIDYYIERNNKLSFFFIALATTIHSMFAIYFLLYLTNIKYNIRNVLYFIFAGVVGWYLLNTFSLIDLMFLKIDTYIEGGGQSAHYGFIVHWISIFFMFFVLKIMKPTVMNISDIKKVRFFNVVYKLYSLLFITLPLLTLNLQFYRIHRNLLLLIYIIFTMYLSVSQIKYKRRYLFLCIVVFSYLFIVIGIFSIYSGEILNLNVRIDTLTSNVLIKYFLDAI